MKKLLLFIFLFIFSKNARAQVAEKELVGNYYLTGLREIGSGFELLANGTFQFFFSYGALDRAGNGTWKIVGDSLVLKSTKIAEKDYKLEKTEKRNIKGTTIKITCANNYLAEKVFVQINGGKNTPIQKVDSYGSIHFEESGVEKIDLIFQFCPEKISKFTITKKSYNYFEFNMLPSIFDVNFNDMKLKISPNKLTGNLPFLDEKEYDFIKEK